MSQRVNKLFILGLPRTGTTSLCSAMLHHGYKVAHTAYSKQSIELADVVADTPAYCDFRKMDVLFPESLFVYLSRDVDFWLPSVQQLLLRLNEKMRIQHGSLNPVIRRCFQTIFDYDEMTGFDMSPTVLKNQYEDHRLQVAEYFKHRDDFLSIDISHVSSYQKLCGFLGCAEALDNFPVTNQQGRISDWSRIKHSNKVDPMASGPDGRKYYNF